MIGFLYFLSLFQPKYNQDGGEHEFCFNNEFSRFTHKKIYVSFHVYNNDQSADTDPNQIFTFMDEKAGGIYFNLNDILEAQTSKRLVRLLQSKR